VRFTLDNPAGAPAPAGPFSQVARVEVGDGALLYLSGQVAIDAGGQVVAPGDVTAQSEYVFDVIEALLRAHGATFADIINVRTFLTDIALLSDYMAVRNERITTQPPTSTTVEVSRLVKPGAVLEVEVVAAVSGRR
jgi:enamine deaminase RidA (YjgF/YER057c/UK114 family)